MIAWKLAGLVVAFGIVYVAFDLADRLGAWLIRRIWR